MGIYDPNQHGTFERYARQRQYEAYADNYPATTVQEPMKDVTPKPKLLDQPQQGGESE